MLSIAMLSRSGEPEKANQSGSEESLPPPEDSQPTYLMPAVVGALLPDAPMFVFYAVEKLAIGSSEKEIWSTRYFLDAWQDFFDLFNSLPIVLACLWICWRSGRVGWSILFASMLLHIVADLPLHHDDGHRHFWPLSEWRFESPVSYWDPKHHGIYAAGVELALFVGCYIHSIVKHKRLAVRAGLSLLAAIHIGLMTLMFVFWSSL